MTRASSSSSLTPAAFPDQGHDHGACRRQALRRAEGLCAARGARLTPLRRQVLDILWQDHRPLSAYHILDRLNSGAHGDRGRPAAPPTVYRALDFLVAEGLAHRLASLNAYVGCPRPEAAHGAQFFICRVCGAVAEVRDEAVSRDIAGAGAALGFTVVAPVVEVQGVCPNCRSADAADAATGEATS